MTATIAPGPASRGIRERAPRSQRHRPYPVGPLIARSQGGSIAARSTPRRALRTPSRSAELEESLPQAKPKSRRHQDAWTAALRCALGRILTSMPRTRASPAIRLRNNQGRKVVSSTATTEPIFMERRPLKTRFPLQFVQNRLIRRFSQADSVCLLY